MKNLSLLFKYFGYGASIAAIVFFFLWSGVKKDLETSNKDLEAEKNNVISLTAQLQAQKDFTNNLQKSFKKRDTAFKEEIGQIHVDYTSKLKKRDNLIRKYKNKPPEYILIHDTTSDIKTLKDRFKTPNLTLDYSLKYKGDFLGIKFDYRVKEKIVVEDNIIYEDVLVDRPVYIKSNYFIFEYDYIISSASKNHDFSVGYITKSGFGFRTGVLLFNDTFYPKVGLSFMIPKK